MRLLSLDVALGGVIFTNSIGYVFELDLPRSISVSLFIAIWLIYTLDHLMDAKKLDRKASMPRHQFHQKNRRSIIIGMAVMIVLGLSAILFLPFATMVFGFAVAGIVLIYFLLSWKLKVVLIKEVFIASLYAVGIFIGPISLVLSDVKTILILFIQTFLLALLNLLLLAYYEITNDKQDGQHSWAVRFGHLVTERHLYIIFGMLATFQAMTILLISDNTLLMQCIFFGMNMILFVIFRAQSFFKINERYRTCGDAIFFLPGLIFWF